MQTAWRTPRPSPLRDRSDRRAAKIVQAAAGSGGAVTARQGSAFMPPTSGTAPIRSHRWNRRVQCRATRASSPRE